MPLAGQLWYSGIQIAAADSPPGGKEHEGLEQEPESSLSCYHTDCLGNF
jgi:hypothetical protein